MKLKIFMKLLRSKKKEEKLAKDKKMRQDDGK